MNPVLTTLVSFNGASGQFPDAGLIADAAGDFFGTTSWGGASGYGTVFELVNDGGSNYTPVTLLSFSDTPGVEGSESGLIADATGDLFGTTPSGGTADDGTVFELVSNGGGSYTPVTLLSFNGENGALPFAGLIADAAGDLFGTTASGGANGDGTVFEIAKTGTGYASTQTILFSFNGMDGASPVRGLIADATGDLFGTTNRAGRTALARCSSWRTMAASTHRSRCSVSTAPTARIPFAAWSPTPTGISSARQKKAGRVEMARCSNW